MTKAAQGCSPSLSVLRGDILLPLLFGRTATSRLQRWPLQRGISNRVTGSDRMSLRTARYLPTGSMLHMACVLAV